MHNSSAMSKSLRQLDAIKNVLISCCGGGGGISK